VAGIDADLAKVHGAWVETIDARPRLAAVGRFVDAAILGPVGSLAILGILNLTAERGGVRPVGVALATASATRAEWPAGRPLADRQLDLHIFAVANELDLDLVACIMIPVLFG